MNDDRIDKLERLARLKSSGDISASEFEAEKAKVLNATANGFVENPHKTRLIYLSAAGAAFLVVIVLAIAFIQTRPTETALNSGDQYSSVAEPVLPLTPQNAPLVEHPVTATMPTPEVLPVQPPHPVAPKIEGDWRSMRTRIREGWGTQPTFANRYVIIRFGCGTGCTGNIVGDHRTGDLYPLGLGGEGYDQLELEFNNASNMLTASWGEIENQTCVVQRYRWTGTELEEIGSRKTTPRVDYTCE